jgi:hypothetical protein
MRTHNRPSECNKRPRADHVVHPLYDTDSTLQQLTPTHPEAAVTALRLQEPMVMKSSKPAAHATGNGCAPARSTLSATAPACEITAMSLKPFPAFASSK